MKNVLREIWEVLTIFSSLAILIIGMAHSLWAIYLDAFQHGQGMDHHLAWGGLCLAVSALRKFDREP